MQNMRETAPYAAGNIASMLAAQGIEEKLKGIRADVFRHILSCGEHGATGSEIAQSLDILQYTAKPRCTELRDAGYVVDSGKLRLNKNKSSETVWCATAHWKELPSYQKKKNAEKLTDEEFAAHALSLFDGAFERNRNLESAFLPIELHIIRKALGVK